MKVIGLIICLLMTLFVNLFIIIIMPAGVAAFAHGDVIGVPVTATPGHWASVVGEWGANRLLTHSQSLKLVLCLWRCALLFLIITTTLKCHSYSLEK